MDKVMINDKTIDLRTGDVPRYTYMRLVLQIM